MSIGQSCPGCHTPVTSGQANMGQRPTSGKAIAALVLGICSIVGCLFYGVPGIVCGILAIVFAGQVRREVEAGEVSPAVLGQANSGRICGWVGLGLSALMVVLMVVYIIVVVTFVANAPQPQPTPSTRPSVTPSPRSYPLLEDLERDGAAALGMTRYR